MFAVTPFLDDLTKFVLKTDSFVEIVVLVKHNSRVIFGAVCFFFSITNCGISYCQVRNFIGEPNNEESERNQFARVLSER